MAGVINGTGSPEGAQTAGVGTIYQQTDATIRQRAVWVKKSGAGNTGWNMASQVDYADVQDYGAKGDGSTDDTSAFQAAADDAKTLNLALYISRPSTAYKLAGTVTVQGDTSSKQRVWIQHQAAEIRDYNTTGPCIKFAGGTDQMTGLWVHGLRVANYHDTHRVPAVQFGDSNGLCSFFVGGLIYDGRDLKGDATTWVNAFNGVFRDSVVLRGIGGVGVVMHSIDPVVSGNIEFANINVQYAPCGFVINDAVAGAVPGLLNSVHFNNCKVVRDSPYTNAYKQGTIGAAASSTSTTVTVSAGTGADYPGGTWVVISSQSGNNLWLSKIASRSGDVLTLAESGGLPFSVAVGDFIMRSNYGAICGQNTASFVFTVPHFERVIGVVGYGAVDFDINQAEMSVECFRLAVLMRLCQHWIVRKPHGANGDGTNFVILDQLNDANNGFNSVRGTSTLQTMSPTPVPLAWGGGVQASVTERYHGTPTLLGIWHQDTTVAANQSNTQLTGPMGAQRSFVIMNVGGATITRLVVNVSAARSNGTLTATAFLNGVATGLNVTIDATHTAHNTKESFYSSDGNAVFVGAGNYVDVRVTTTGTWAPTANSVDVQLWGEF